MSALCLRVCMVRRGVWVSWTSSLIVWASFSLPWFLSLSHSLFVSFSFSIFLCIVKRVVLKRHTDTNRTTGYIFARHKRNGTSGVAVMDIDSIYKGLYTTQLRENPRRTFRLWRLYARGTRPAIAATAERVTVGTRSNISPLNIWSGFYSIY